MFIYFSRNKHAHRLDSYGKYWRGLGFLQTMKTQEVASTNRALCGLYWALQLMQLGFQCYVPQLCNFLLPSTMPLTLTHYAHGLAIMLKIQPVLTHYTHRIIPSYSHFYP